MKSISIKEINKLALPAIVSGIAEPVISLVDTSIIGHLGADQLGGVGIASSFFLLIVWVLSQTKSAISALVSKYFGKRELHKVETLIAQSLLINLLLGVMVFAICYPFTKQIFELYGAKGVLLEKAMIYFKIRSLGFPLVLGTFAIFGVFRGIQNTKWAMQISLVGGIVNLLFDIILVFGIEGIVPSYGIAGAAYATLIAQVVMFALSIYYFVQRSGLKMIWSREINPEIFKLLSMSGNLFVRTLSLNVAYFVSNRLATAYGTNYIAAHTIAMNIWLFSAFFIDGYANAGNAISGRLLGEENFIALKELGKTIRKISVGIGVLLAIFYGLLYFQLGHWFSNDKDVIALFQTFFWIVIISQPINSIAFGYDGLYKGLGEAKYLRDTLLLATFVCFVPIAYTLDYLDLKLYGIWIAFLGFMTLRALRLWRKYNLMY